MKKTIWERIFINPWMAGLVGSAFLSFICFIQTSQYVAEKTGKGLWIVLGSVFAIAAVYCFKRLNESSTGKGG